MAHIVPRPGKTGTTYQVRWDRPQYGGQSHNVGREKLDAVACKRWVEYRDHRVSSGDDGLRDRVYIYGELAEAESSPTEVVTFGELARSWCFDKRPRASAQSKEMYWSRIQQLDKIVSVPHFLAKPIHTVTSDDLSKIIKELQGGHSNSTIGGYFVCVKGALRLAEKQGLLTKNPYDEDEQKLNPVDPSEEVDKFLSRAEVEGIASCAKADSQDIVEFLYETGFRNLST